MVRADNQKGEASSSTSNGKNSSPDGSGLEYQPCGGREEVCRIWSLLSLEEKKEVLALRPGDLKRVVKKLGYELRNQNERIYEKPEVITPIRRLFCLMLEGGDQVPSLDIHKKCQSAMILLIFQIFEEKLEYYYVKHSVRVKIHMFMFLLVWIWIRSLALKLIFSGLLGWVFTWKVLIAVIVHPLMRPFENENADHFNAKFMAFVSAFMCIELGFWLSWYMSLKIFALVPLFLLSIEVFLSGVESVRNAAIVATNAVAVYLAWYSWPVFITACSMFFPFLASKALLILLLGFGLFANAIAYVQATMGVPKIDEKAAICFICIGILFLVISMRLSYVLMVGNIIVLLVLIPSSYVTITKMSCLFAANVIRAKAIDCVLLAHLTDIGWRYLIYRACGGMPRTPFWIRSLAERMFGKEWVEETE
eukprot:CAMPEP_0114489400 /NCGR_PEP_ID=MMETSP0109-20121206/1871_1 /TAXON_ID=29199 /ORGANISM="Chlorarachnion reptans, Strain CCCM449" /LENGTH=420 /DNA_ID=CAMNT_0001665913 /DNA_START=35 /DNA_END=1294 /DNA_ORIENTATION=+